MKKLKTIRSEEILDDILKSIKYHIRDNKDGRTTLESFFRKYKYIIFKNGYMFFSANPFVYDKRLGFHWNNDSVYIDISVTYTNGVHSSVGRHIATYRRVMPYFKFELSGEGLWCSDTKESKLLLDSFPTRKNIITKLLAEL